MMTQAFESIMQTEQTVVPRLDRGIQSNTPKPSRYRVFPRLDRGIQGGGRTHVRQQTNQKTLAFQ